MTRETLDSLGRETLIRLVLAQAEAIAALTRECEALRARGAELEAKLDLPRKTPDNSSTPPSQGAKAPSAPASKPKGKAHPGAHRPLHQNPAAKRDIFAASCQHCGADVSQRPQIACEAYDRVEIPKIEPEVTRVTLFGGTCPCCARTFKAPPPQDMPEGPPYGPDLRAFVIYLRFTQGAAFERLAALLSDLPGPDISEGALINMLDASREAFAAQMNSIRQHLLSGTALQSGETGLRAGKKNWWLRVFRHKDSAVFHSDPERIASPRSYGRAGAGQGRGRGVSWRLPARLLGLRPLWRTNGLVPGKDHQVCLAHLIRDVQYAIAAGDGVFAPDLRHLLGRACRIGRRRERLAGATLKTCAARLGARLDQLMTRQPAHEAGVKLQRMIKRTRRTLFVFVTNRDLPAANNGSERALRPCAVFRKITNGFRTGWGARPRAVQRSIQKFIKTRDLRPPRAAAVRSFRMLSDWL